MFLNKNILLGGKLLTIKFEEKLQASRTKIRSWKARSSSATRDKPVSLSTEGGKERGGNDRGKARRSHEISLDRADV